MVEGTTPLTYDRQTLVDTLNERIAERAAERAAKAAAAAEKNKTARDAIVELIDKYPSFLVWVTNQLDKQWQAGGKPGTEAFATAVANSYSASDGLAAPPYDPDEELKRLVRVYEKAKDDEVKITVYDDVFRYL